jgi:uncharacterized protein YfaT (DUF1175 family)
MSRPPVRASDHERERASAALRWHYAAGRLELEEFERRIDRVWAAATRREIATVFSDLPAERWARGLRRFAAFQRLAVKVHGTTWAAANGLLVGVWWATGGGDFWPQYALVPSTGVLAWHAGGTYLLWRALPARPGRSRRV